MTAKRGWETDDKNQSNRKDLQGIRKSITFLMARKIRAAAEKHEDVCAVSTLFTAGIYATQKMSECVTYSKHRVLLT